MVHPSATSTTPLYGTGFCPPRAFMLWTGTELELNRSCRDILKFGIAAVVNVKLRSSSTTTPLAFFTWTLVLALTEAAGVASALTLGFAAVVMTPTHAGEPAPTHLLLSLTRMLSCLSEQSYTFLFSEIVLFTLSDAMGPATARPNG